MQQSICPVAGQPHQQLLSRNKGSQLVGDPFHSLLVAILLEGEEQISLAVKP
jgi:hypothetical protein